MTTAPPVVSEEIEKAIDDGLIEAATYYATCGGFADERADAYDALVAARASLLEKISRELEAQYNRGLRDAMGLR